MILPDIMRTADLLVYPSFYYEPFSLVKAMASGLPVITARTAGVADLLSPACGIIIEDPGHTGALSEALRALTQAPEGRKTMGQAARAVTEQYDFRTMAEQ